MKERFIKFYMNFAKAASDMSYAEKLKVGAVLVKNDNILSWSYNGTPRNWDNTCEHKIYKDEDKEPNQTYDYWDLCQDGNHRHYRLKTKSEVTHAEEALIMKIASSHESAEGASLFCTHSCCIHCAKLIYGAKISEFYYKDEYRSDEGIKFLQKCGIKVTKLED